MTLWIYHVRSILKKATWVDHSVPRI